MADRICTECEKRVHARGLCVTHYNRWKRRRDPNAEPLLNLSSDIAERFWARVDKTTGACWLWNSSTRDGGYGVFAFNGVRYTAHLWAYENTVGAVPSGLQLDHTCHTSDASCTGGPGCSHRRCVNPDHLEPVTPRENTLRGRTLQAENAAKTHCVNGHPFDAANTHHGRNGARVCRACQRAATARYRAKKRPKTSSGATR